MPSRCAVLGNSSLESDIKQAVNKDVNELGNCRHEQIAPSHRSRNSPIRDVRLSLVKSAPSLGDIIVRVGIRSRVRRNMKWDPSVESQFGKKAEMKFFSCNRSEQIGF